MRLLIFLILSVQFSYSYANKPNILLIMVDDLGYSDLGCFGGEIKTPQLDQLADQGLKLTQLYNSARCCPTRASLMTGLYPHQTGIGFMAADNQKPGYRGFLTDNCVTTAQLLKRNGYKTYLAGKWHLRGHGNLDCTPTNRGFDEFYGPFRDYASFYREDIYHKLPEGSDTLKTTEPFYATDAITDYALHFLNKARQAQKPYYLYLAYNAPHFPLQAPKNIIDKYIEIYSKGWDHIRESRLIKMQQLDIIPRHWNLSKRGITPKVPNRNLNSPYYGKTIPAWKSLSLERRNDLTRRMATYAAMVEIVDTNIGRVIKDIKQNNELNNTCIVFLSDNGACAEWDPYGFDDNPYPTNKLHKGPELNTIGQEGSFHSYGTGWANACNTPFSAYKHYTYEGGISTSAILHYPKELKGIKGIQRQPLHVMDIAATILDISQTSYPKTWKGNMITPLQGKSIIPTLQQNKTNSDRVLYFEHEGNRGVRKGEHKLVWTNYEKTWKLFNLKSDRSETNNIAHLNPEVVTQLSKLWLNWALKCNVELEKVPQPLKGMPTIYYNK